MRYRLFSAFALLLIASSAMAADDPLDAFPAETGVVLRIGAPSATSGKAKGFLNNAAPRYSGVTDSLAPALGSLIGNPTLAGIDPKRDWYVAVLPRAEQSPSLVYAVPASNVAELKKAVGQGYTFAEIDKWVVYSLDAEAVKKTSATKPETSVRTILSEPLQKIFGEGELAVVLNAVSLKKTYRAQIDRAKEQMIKAAGAAPPGVQPSNALRMGQDYNRKFIESMMKSVEDASVITKRISIADDSLKIEALATFESGSDSAKFVATQAPSELPLFNKLPTGRLLYYDFAGDFSGLIAASTKMTLAAFPMNVKLQPLMKDLESVKFHEFAGAMGLGDLDGGVVRGVSLANVESADEYRTLVRRMVEAMGSSDAGDLKQEMSIKPDAETIEGIKVDLVKAAFKRPDDSAGAQATNDAMEIMFGKDGMTQRIGVVDGIFVQAIGDADQMSTAVKAVRGNGAETDPAAKAAAKARNELQPRANLVILSDLPRVMGGALQVAIESKRLPIPIDVAAIENINLAPSYTGMAVVTEEEALRIRGVLPAEQVRGFVELVNVMQKAAPPQRGRAN